MDFSVIVITLVLGLLGFLGFYLKKILKDQSEKENDAGPVETDSSKDEKKNQETSSSSTGLSRRKLKTAAGTGTEKHLKDKFSHPWLLATLKGHSGRVSNLDFSENGKYLASCADDRSVLLWTVKEFPNKEHKTHRVNVSYDTANFIKWSPDSRAFIVNKVSSNCIEVYKIAKKEDGSHGFGNVSVVHTFPSVHDTDVIGIGFAATGKFMMSCSDKTTLTIWSIHGEILATLDTYHMSTYCAKVSPCGRFVATSGFTPDVKVWEVKFNRSGEFDKVHRAFELPGHASGVFDFDFNSDSSRIVTLGKDDTWRLFKTNVEFERGQDPSCIIKGEFRGADPKSVISLSPDARIVTIGNGTKITWFLSRTAQIVGTIDQVHHDPITCLKFDKECRWLISSGDKHIRVFHNVPGMKESLQELKDKLRTANSEGMKERLKVQIDELAKKLAVLEN